MSERARPDKNVQYPGQMRAVSQTKICAEKSGVMQICQFATRKIRAEFADRAALKIDVGNIEI